MRTRTGETQQTDDSASAAEPQSFGSSEQTHPEGVSGKPDSAIAAADSEKTASSATVESPPSKPAPKQAVSGTKPDKKTPTKATKLAPLPGPEIKRAAKKAAKKVTTQEKLASVEQQAVVNGRRPLDGIRILDLSRLLPGPYASHILACFGAEVIKIEKPREGDYMREYAPHLEGVNAVFQTINRGKKSFAVDLKHPSGKEVFLALVKKSDVLIDGHRPGVMDQLSLGYEHLREVNPKLIYAALTGYGQTGRFAGCAGHDLNYIAFGGMLDLLADTDGSPLLPGIQIADIAAGALPTVIGILLALQHRSRSHKGQMVDIAMLDAVLGLMPVQIANYTATKRRPKRGHERLFGRYACYNVYPVRNGRYVAVGALEPKFWKELCVALEREDLIDEQYLEGDAQQILIAELTRIFQKKEVSEWMELFADRDVCVTEVREISRVVQDDSLTERGMVVPTRSDAGGVYEQLGVFPKLSETPGYIEGEAPFRGEQTRQLLRSLNYSVKRINALFDENVVEEAPPE